MGLKEGASFAVRALEQRFGFSERVSLIMGFETIMSLGYVNTPEISCWLMKVNYAVNVSRIC